MFAVNAQIVRIASPQERPNARLPGMELQDLEFVLQGLRPSPGILSSYSAVPPF